LESIKVLILHRNVNSPRRLAAALLGAALCAAAGTAPAATYRWVDDSGEVVYSQFPPPPGREARVIGAPPPPAETPEQANRRLMEALQQSEDRREDEDLANKDVAKEQAAAADAVRRCQAARDNLKNLEEGPGNRRYRDASGEYRRMDDETWEAEKTKARQVIEKYCN
jgi:hypothetical protein